MRRKANKTVEVVLSITHSPLRYPGGKSILSPLLGNFIEINNLLDGIYIEPYAGGAGAALKLLFSEYVNEIILNDADKSIFSFWYSILNHTEDFIKLIYDTPVNLEEWDRQRYIFKNPSSFNTVQIGFSTFFLNRCNRSGILYAGPIGGQYQSGAWHLDVRFNKLNLEKKIEKIALYKSRISIFNKDALVFLEKYVKSFTIKNQKILVYLDPPYYSKGSQLYLNYYNHEDHVMLSKYILGQKKYKWIISYDDVPEIKALYNGLTKTVFSINYFVHRAKIGKEIIIYCPDCNIPNDALEN